MSVFAVLAVRTSGSRLDSSSFKNQPLSNKAIDDNVDNQHDDKDNSQVTDVFDVTDVTGVSDNLKPTQSTPKIRLYKGKQFTIVYYIIK